MVLPRLGNFSMREPIWEQQPEESHGYYKAFLNYLSMPLPRDLEKAAEKAQKNPSTYRNYFYRFRWEKRASAWDLSPEKRDAVLKAQIEEGQVSEIEGEEKITFQPMPPQKSKPKNPDEKKTMVPLRGGRRIAPLSPPVDLPEVSVDNPVDVVNNMFKLGYARIRDMINRGELPPLHSAVRMVFEAVKIFREIEKERRSLAEALGESGSQRVELDFSAYSSDDLEKLEEIIRKGRQNCSLGQKN